MLFQRLSLFPKRMRTPMFAREVEEVASLRHVIIPSAPRGRQTQREFARAIKRGMLLRSEGSTIPLTDAKVLAELVEKAKANVTRAISIGLPVVDLERAQRIAARDGIGYQTVLKRAIHAGLKKVS